MVILPLLAFFLLAVLLPAVDGDDLRPRLLHAGLLVGAVLTLITEGLNLFSRITYTGLSFAWGAVDLALLAVLLQRLRRGWKPVPWKLCLPHGWMEWICAAGLVILLGLTLLVAWVAPVQTPDSLSYHMARVAHWAQEGSVNVFASGNERQNFMSPFAEFAVLQSYVLSGGDRFVNLVNWLAYLGTILAGSWLARQLGARRSGQILSAVFAASIPTVIAQASSTTTDLMVSFWGLCLAVEVLNLIQKGSRTGSWFYAALAVALGVLTKPTSLIFTLPLLIWLGLALWRKNGFFAVLRGVGIVLFLTLILNAGYFFRNISAYGNPMGPQEILQYHSNQIHTPAAVASNLVRNLGLNLGTVGTLNHILTNSVEKLHLWMGIDPNDPRTTMTGPYIIIGPRTEDNIGALVSLVVVIAGMTLLLIRLRHSPMPLRWFALSLAVGYLLFSIIEKWQLFGSRLQTPFFVLAAGWVGALFAVHLRDHWVHVLSVILLLSAIPWTLFIPTRPLVPIKGYTYGVSILNSDRTDLNFISAGIRPESEEIVHAIQQSRCSSVGLMLKGDTPEYQWWETLKQANIPNLRIEWRVAGTPSAKYTPVDFTPCALIVNDRPVVSTLDGFSLAVHNGSAALYLR